MKKIIALIFGLLVSVFCFGQDTIYILNPSFEGYPAPDRVPKKWYNSVNRKFPDQTPPDIQPIKDWGESPTPSHGQTYVGLVTRYDETWEGIAQKLSEPLTKDSCFMASIDLCKSKEYASPTIRNPNRKENFIQPVVLRVWLSNKPFNPEQLVYESEMVNYSEWKTNSFIIRPKQNYKYIHLQCYYKTPVIFPYNGHLLLDNMSHLVKISCR